MNVARLILYAKLNTLSLGTSQAGNSLLHKNQIALISLAFGKCSEQKDGPHPLTGQLCPLEVQDVAQPSTNSASWPFSCSPVLVKGIGDEFGVKGDVRQTVAVLDSANHPRSAERRGREMNLQPRPMRKKAGRETRRGVLTSQAASGGSWACGCEQCNVYKTETKTGGN